MEQIRYFIKISELFVRGSSQNLDAEYIRGEEAVAHVAEALQMIKLMSNAEREKALRLLAVFLCADEFGHQARPALRGAQNLCIAECLLADHEWKMPDLSAVFGNNFAAA